MANQCNSYAGWHKSLPDGVASTGMQEHNLECCPVYIVDIGNSDSAFKLVWLERQWLMVVMEWHHHIKIVLGVTCTSQEMFSILCHCNHDVTKVDSASVCTNFWS